MVVELTPCGDGRWEARGSSSSGTGRHVLASPFARDELPAVLAAVGRAVRAGRDFHAVAGDGGPAAAVATPEAVGESLFRELFTGELRDLYLLSLAGGTDRVVLRLRFTSTDGPADPLLSLPWETLRDPRRGYLWRQRPALTVVRTLAVARPRQAPVACDRLRVLLVLGEAPDLDLAAERTVVEAAARRSGSLEIHTLSGGTVEALRDGVLDVRPHVVHFMGHGRFGDAGGRLVLGPWEIVGSEVFADLLSGLDALRLVVLNACDGGRFGRPGREPTRGSVAASLVRRGVPAVVAMQFAVSDAAAIAFSAGFYRALARGGEVSEAVDEGRRSIVAADELSLEWIAPLCLDSGERHFELRRPSASRASRWLGAGSLAAAGMLLGLAGPLLGLGAVEVARGRNVGSDERSVLLAAGVAAALSAGLAALGRPWRREASRRLVLFLVAATALAGLAAILVSHLLR